MAKSINHETEISNVFEKAMLGTTSLKTKEKVDLSLHKKNRKIKKIITISDNATKNIITEDTSIAAVTSMQNLFFANKDVRIKTIKQLKKGFFKIEKILDLHGQTVAIARGLLNIFLYEAQTNNLRVILIIHGKNVLSSNDEPKIKNMVNRILQNHETVLAFCSSLPKHGGVGATYVLLKKIEPGFTRNNLRSK